MHTIRPRLFFDAGRHTFLPGSQLRLFSATWLSLTSRLLRATIDLSRISVLEAASTEGLR